MCPSPVIFQGRWYHTWPIKVLHNPGLESPIKLKFTWLLNKLFHVAPGSGGLEFVEINLSSKNIIPRFSSLIHGSGQPSAFMSLFLHDNFLPGHTASPWLWLGATIGFPKFESLRRWFKDLVLFHEKISLLPFQVSAILNSIISLPGS